MKWLLPTPLHIESSPAIEGDIVVAGAGAIEVGPDHKPNGDPEGRGHPGYVLGARISDGKQLWRFPVIDPESSPAIHDGIAMIGSGLNGGEVVALKIAEDVGEEERLLWRTKTPFPATGSVTLHEDLVLIGCGNGDFVFAAPMDTTPGVTSVNLTRGGSRVATEHSWSDDGLTLSLEQLYNECADAHNYARIGDNHWKREVLHANRFTRAPPWAWKAAPHSPQRRSVERT